MAFDTALIRFRSVELANAACWVKYLCGKSVPVAQTNGKSQWRLVVGESVALMRVARAQVSARMALVAEDLLPTACHRIHI